MHTKKINIGKWGTFFFLLIFLLGYFLGKNQNFLIISSSFVIFFYYLFLCCKQGKGEKGGKNKRKNINRFNLFLIVILFFSPKNQRKGKGCLSSFKLFLILLQKKNEGNFIIRKKLKEKKGGKKLT